MKSMKKFKARLNQAMMRGYVIVQSNPQSTMVVGAVGLLIMSIPAAHAITAPAAGSFAYDMYDVGVNKILKGAPGFIGGMVGIVVSATQLSSNWKAAGLGILASTAVIKADSITKSLGMIV
ncbi:hypothetical protein [Pseudoalteromonas luteoviolacea]|uniref:hypothetical protein n=1 Tax=Pseudoalteromonas luteoviolacea TaxID=43657 RepID=UPI001B38AE0F|nr:hypothetical protein [Pseudoalteromonas luteoviolacea]MBQ4839835.1 hypothetical protein [Pseudoalteromonas luteoviolacea]